VEKSKNRTGYSQSAVVPGLDQYTIAINMQKEVVLKILNV